MFGRDIYLTERQRDKYEKNLLDCIRQRINSTFKRTAKERVYLIPVQITNSVNSVQPVELWSSVSTGSSAVELILALQQSAAEAVEVGDKEGAQRLEQINRVSFRSSRAIQ